MSTTQASKMSDSVLSKNVLIQRTDLSTFDDSFSFLKEKFAAEMRRVDEEMTKFSTDLMHLYEQISSAQPGIASDKDNMANWETITSSPLVQGEGGSKTLKLQFDVSQFEPADIKVQIVKDVLTVSATYETKTDNSNIFRDFKRSFLLPKGTNPENVISSLSRDGVLTVQAPLPTLQKAIEHLPGTQEVKSQLILYPSRPQSPNKTSAKGQK